MSYITKQSKLKGEAEEARKLAKEHVFDRTVIFGLGTTGMFIGDLIRQKYPEAKIVFVARSEKESPKVSFALEQAKADYVQSKFDTNEELAAAIQEELGGTATLFIGTSGSNVEHDIAFKYDNIL